MSTALYISGVLLRASYLANQAAVRTICDFIAQLVEHRTSIAEVTGSNPVEALIFFRLLSNCLS